MDILEEIRLLANVETDERKLLSVIVAGQPELGDRLNDPALRQFKQRIALRCELRPLTLPESAAYIAGRITAAGGVGSHVFTREAVILMYERAKGIPRTISVLADNALLSGFALGVRPVGSQIVRDVCRDFDLPGGDELVAQGAPATSVPDASGSLLDLKRMPLAAGAEEPAGSVESDDDPQEAAASGSGRRRRFFLF